MSDTFQNLLADLNAAQESQTLIAKALPTGAEGDDNEDDEKIKAAAAAAEADKAKGAGEGGEADKGEAGEGGEGKPLAKSFTVKLADGSEVEATDGAELVKALSERIDATEGVMAKALGQAVTLIKSQGEMIKSLGDQVKKLGGEGRGRKTIVSITEKTAGAGAAAQEKAATGLTVPEFMAKSESAFKSGRISGVELNTIDVSARMGQAVDPALVSKVLAV